MNNQQYKTEQKFCHQGPFWYQHNFPPAPFNPKFDPKAASRWDKVSSSMRADNYYATHTQEECKKEWARRYNLLSGDKNVQVL